MSDEEQRNSPEGHSAQSQSSIIPITPRHPSDVPSISDLSITIEYGSPSADTDTSFSRQGFSRPSNRNGNQRGNGGQTPSASPISTNNASNSPLPHSPSPSSNVSVDSPHVNAHEGQVAVSTKPPFFFREEHAGFVVKGNFMTLAAKPQHVELGEWLAHHMVELYRILVCQLQCIQEIDANTGNPICNPRTCPTMSAATHTYTWLDQNKSPVKIPAYQYISLVQKWISGKLLDPNTFPTDPNTVSSATPSAATYASGGLNTPGSNTPIPAGPTSLNVPLSTLAGPDWIGKASNFPEHFYADCKNIARQMFRCYAHLYWGHWLDPFHHIGRTKDLNSCFVHFLNVSLLFGLLTEKDTEPMQPLIDIWIANKSISTENVANSQQRQATPSPSANAS